MKVNGKTTNASISGKYLAEQLRVLVEGQQQTNLRLTALEGKVDTFIAGADRRRTPRVRRAPSSG
jgi:hypothetical protein